MSPDVAWEAFLSRLVGRNQDLATQFFTEESREKLIFYQLLD
jgi:hypothetical protein